jgi:hypothetical protein
MPMSKIAKLSPLELESLEAITDPTKIRDAVVEIVIDHHMTPTGPPKGEAAIAAEFEELEATLLGLSAYRGIELVKDSEWGFAQRWLKRPW